MSPTPPRPSPASRARAAAALLTMTAALAASGEPAAAATTARARGATRVHAKARAKARAHAKLHARAHATVRAHLHGRHHAHLHALTTVAAADAAESESGAASLRGSHAAVDRAYDEAVREGLPFVHSNAELERRAGEGEYVALSRSTATYQLKGVTSPYVRPATRNFVTKFAADYARQCGEPLTVTSAMRPTSIRLRNSVEKTVHPTGIAVDLRASRSAGCRSWMRATLLDMENAGTIDATEEHHPPHFHVVVLREP